MTSVLIIDDEPDLLAVLGDMLGAAGYAVRTAADGNAGIASYRENPADLVLMDILMPGKEGISTQIELKQEFPDVKIIAMSGGGQIAPERYLNAASTFGARAVLAKPISRQTLLDTVESCLKPDPE